MLEKIIMKEGGDLYNEALKYIQKFRQYQYQSSFTEMALVKHFKRGLAEELAMILFNRCLED